MREVQQLLGFRIKSIRKSKKISQEKLAELMDISVTSVSNIETGKRAVSLKTLNKLSKVLNIKAYELFLFNDIDPKKEILKQIYSNLESKSIRNNVEKLLIIERLTTYLKDA